MSNITTTYENGVIFEEETYADWIFELEMFWLVVGETCRRDNFYVMPVRVSTPYSGIFHC